jgi:hypothetical protein
VRKALLIVGLLVALAVPATAFAGKQPVPDVICGTACDGGGGGWTGCTQTTASDSANVGVARINHFLVVSYCKSNGWITSISIAAHGCDTGGLVSCSPGPAWMTGGGVGDGYATFEAHATWTVLVPPFLSNEDVLTLTVPVG